MEEQLKPIGPRAVRVLWAYIRAMRPLQWTKNLLVFVPLLFTVDLEWSPGDVASALDLFSQCGIAFVYFCLLSGGLYLFNDFLDVERDRAHPQKRSRPIAAGQISRAIAGALGIGLVAGLPFPAFALGTSFGLVVLGYAVTQFAYSLGLKRVVLLDVGIVSSGFVLRVLAGAAAIGVQASPWLFISSGLGALFIVLCKRRSELATAGDLAVEQRDSLRSYTVPFLDQLIGIVATSVLLSYAFYTFIADKLPEDHSMMLTIPIVVYGLFRYLYLVYTRNAGESPEKIIFTDAPILVSIVVWTLASAAILIVGR